MSEQEGDRRWIVTPPGPEQIALRLDVGEDVELTAEQIVAVEQLLAVLEAGEAEEAEVSGFAVEIKEIKIKATIPGAPPPPPPPSCTGIQCTGMSCSGLTIKFGAMGGGWSLGGTFGVGR